MRSRIMTWLASSSQQHKHEHVSSDGFTHTGRRTPDGACCCPWVTATLTVRGFALGEECMDRARARGRVPRNAAFIPLRVTGSDKNPFGKERVARQARHQRALHLRSVHQQSLT